MNRILLTLVAGMAITVGFNLTGCKSPQWGIKNPFAPKPKANIKSPADMDEMDLKAPPERYTRDDYLQKMEKNSESKGALAQQGSYQARQDGYHERDGGEFSSENSGRSDRVAMNDLPRNGSASATLSEKRSNSAAADDDRRGYDVGTDSGYSNAPGFDDFPTALESGDSSVPFAPGSIGGY